MPLSPSLLTEPNSNENLTSFTVTPALIGNEEFTELLLSSSTGKEIEHCKDKNIEIYLETGPNGTAENLILGKTKVRLEKAPTLVEFDNLRTSTDLLKGQFRKTTKQSDGNPPNNSNTTNRLNSNICISLEIEEEVGYLIEGYTQEGIKGLLKKQKEKQNETIKENNDQVFQINSVENEDDNIDDEDLLSRTPQKEILLRKSKVKSHAVKKIANNTSLTPSKNVSMLSETLMTEEKGTKRKRETNVESEEKKGKVDRHKGKLIRTRSENIPKNQRAYENFVVLLCSNLFLCGENIYEFFASHLSMITEDTTIVSQGIRKRKNIGGAMNNTKKNFDFGIQGIYYLPSEDPAIPPTTSDAAGNAYKNIAYYIKFRTQDIAEEALTLNGFRLFYSKIGDRKTRAYTKVKLLPATLGKARELAICGLPLHDTVHRIESYATLKSILDTKGSIAMELWLKKGFGYKSMLEYTGKPYPDKTLTSTREKIFEPLDKTLSLAMIAPHSLSSGKGITLQEYDIEYLISVLSRVTNIVGIALLEHTQLVSDLPNDSGNLSSYEILEHALKIQQGTGETEELSQESTLNLENSSLNINDHQFMMKRWYERYCINDNWGKKILSPLQQYQLHQFQQKQKREKQRSKRQKQQDTFNGSEDEDEDEYGDMY